MKVLRCAQCGDVVGSMRAPTREELQKIAAGTAFAAIAGMLPADVTETLTDVLVIYCVAHTKLGDDDGSKEDGEEVGEEVRDEDPLSREVRERDEAARGFLGPGRSGRR